MRKDLAALHPVIQFFLYLLAGLISLAVLSFLVTIIYLLISGNVSDLLSQGLDLNVMSSMGLMKLLQVTQTVGLFMIPYFLFRWVNKEELSYKLGANQKTGVLALIFGLTIFAAYPVINLMAVWNSGLHLPEFMSGIELWMRNMETTAEDLIAQFLVMENLGDLAINLLVIAVFPAVSEELFFRGFLQNTLLKMGRNEHVAIWITAFIFSAIHFQFLGFFPRFLLGALLGYAAMYSGSLIVPIVGHFVNNGFAVALAYIYGTEAMETPEGLGSLSTSEIVFGFGSAALLVLGMILLKRVSFTKA